MILCCVTISPEAARALDAKITAAGLIMLDTPVSGGFVAAHGGSMTVMASGPAAGFVKAGPVLDAIAGKVWRLGDQVGIGSTVKMVNQLLAGVHIATAAEALAMGLVNKVVPHEDLDQEIAAWCAEIVERSPTAIAIAKRSFDVISSSAGSSWMWQNRVPHILAGDDTPLSAVNIFVKDLGIVLDQARTLTFPLPMASSAHQLFLAAAAAGHGGKDDAFVIRVWQALAGIALPEKANDA